MSSFLFTNAEFLSAAAVIDRIVGMLTTIATVNRFVRSRSFLPLDKVITARAAFVIVSGSSRRAGVKAFEVSY